MFHGSHEHVIHVDSGGHGEYEGDCLGDVSGLHALDGLVDVPRLLRIVSETPVLELCLHETRADALNEMVRMSRTIHHNLGIKVES